MFSKIKNWIVQKENIKKASLYLVAFLLLWYYFFLPTVALRPLSIAVVPALTIIGAVLTFVFRKKYVFTVYDATVITAFIVSLLSSFIAASATVAIKYAFSLFVYYFAAKFLTENGNIDKNVLIKMVFGFALFFLLTIFFEKYFTSAFNATFLRLIPEVEHEHIIQNQEYRLYSGLATYTDQTEIYLLIGFICCVYFYSQKTSLIHKIIFVFMAFLFIVGLGFSGRRAAILLAFLVIFGYLLIVSNASWPVIVFGASIFIFGMLLFYEHPRDIPVIGDILAKIKYYLEQGKFFEDRLELVGVASTYIADKPFTGYGADNSSIIVNIENFTSFHNSYVEPIFDYGYIGGIIYLVSIVGPVIAMGVFFFISYFKEIFNYHDVTKIYLGFVFSVVFLVLSIVEALFNNPGEMFIFFVFSLLTFYVLSNKTSRIPAISFNFTKEKKFPFYFKIETFNNAYDIKSTQNSIALFYTKAEPKDALMRQLFDAALDHYLDMGYIVDIIVSERFQCFYNNPNIRIHVIKDDMFYRFSFMQKIQCLVNVDCSKAIIFGNDKKIIKKIKYLFLYFVNTSYVFDSNVEQLINNSKNIIDKMIVKDNINMIYKFVCLDEENYQLLKEKKDNKKETRAILLDKSDLLSSFKESIINGSVI